MNILRWTAAGLLLSGAVSIAAFMVLGRAHSAAFAQDKQDWPGWRGPGRDGSAKGFTPPASWPKELKQGWQVEVGEGHSTPALVDGKLYVFTRQGDDEVTLCLNAADGKEIWRDKHPVDAKFMLEGAAKPHGKGPFASPLVQDGKVFTFGIRSTLSCLDAKSGKKVWREEFDGKFPKPQAEWGSAASPIIVDGAVVVHVGGGPGPLRDGPGKGAIMAFAVADGKLKWTWGGDCAGSSSPIVATIGGKPQLITQTESLVVGLSPADGKLLWQEEFKTSFQQNSVDVVVHGEKVVYSGYGKGVFAIRVGGAKPEPVWQTTDVSMYMSNPILKGDRLFGFSEKKKGHFFCLDAKDGKTLWSGPPRQGENAALVDAGGVILALVTQRPDGKDASHLVVFDAADGKYEERARYKVADVPAWAHPVVSGKSIIVKDRAKLTQWILP